MIPSVFLACFLVTVTPYTPSRGGINGDMMTASGTAVTVGYSLLGAACGPSYPFGTRFFVQRLMDVGYKPEVVCIDRGGMITDRHLDILVYTGKGPAEDWKVAKKLGKRKMQACVVEKERVTRK